MKAVEEKQRRKDEKKAAKVGPQIDVSEVEAEGEGEPVVFDGIGSVKGKATTSIKGKAKLVAEDVEMEVEEDPPILLNHDLPNLQSVLDYADVIVQVLDARDPLAFSSSHLENLATAKPGRRILRVLNKIGSFIAPTVTSFLPISNLRLIPRHRPPRICGILVGLPADSTPNTTFPCIICISSCRF